MKDFVYKLCANWVLIVLFVVIGLLAAFVLNQKQKTFFEASFLVYLKPVTANQWEKSDVSAGYYSQLRVRDFADSLIAFLLQPEVQNKTTGQFRIKKLTPQLLKLQTVGRSESEAYGLINQVEQVVKEESKKLSNSEDVFFQLERLTSSPSLQKNEPNYFLNLLVGGLLGLTLAVLFLATKFYFYPK